MHELLHNGMVAVVCELGGAVAATAMLRFRSGVAKARERQSEASGSE